jgi:thioredoxin-related protein
MFMATFILNMSLRFITGTFERKSTISVVTDRRQQETSYKALFMMV